MTSHLVIPERTLATRQRAKIWAKANPDRVAKNKLAYLLRNPQRRIWKAAKDNAKSGNLEFNIEQDDVVIPDVCPVFKVPFEYKTPFAASIDRIDSSKGYVKGNIQIISRKANVMKNNATAEELKQFAYWVLSQ